MKRRLPAFLIPFVVLLSPIQSAYATPLASRLLGEYEYSSGSAPSDFSIYVSVGRDNGMLALGFTAAHHDAHGAAPDGGGSGTVGRDGVLRFAYEDSFFNSGSGTFQRTKGGGYLLSIHIDQVKDPRCLKYYGRHRLTRRPRSNQAMQRTPKAFGVAVLVSR